VFGLPVATTPPDTYVLYRPSLQAWAQVQLDKVGPLPAYTLKAELDSQGERLAGNMQIVVPNASSEAWRDLVFHLYPNYPHYASRIAASQVMVGGEAAAVELLTEGTALRVMLSEPLQPKAQVAVAMQFTVDLPSGMDGYTLFGWEDGILSLPGFYPTLAVRDSRGWLAAVPPLFADVLFNPAAWYDLEFTAPAKLTVVASGSTLETAAAGRDRRTWHIAGGPLRDMTLLASDRWRSVKDTAAGATVVAYYPADVPAAGQSALFHAAAALRLYSDLYGRYPYTEFKVVAAPLGHRGMEYSGLVAVGKGLYNSDRLAFLVAHETAHQWWYAQVGDDPLQTPWLDEGLAEHAAFDYYRGVYGQQAAEKLLADRWQLRVESSDAGGINGAVDRPIASMDQRTYELLTYAKAALFFNALRERLGDDVYLMVLRAYVEAYRWQVATPQQFFGVAESVSGANLNPLAQTWLR
jgi:hypothetical protein